MTIFKQQLNTVREIGAKKEAAKMRLASLRQKLEALGKEPACPYKAMQYRDQVRGLGSSIKDAEAVLANLEREHKDAKSFLAAV